MKTRLSADAAEAARTNAQAKSAEMDRMLHLTRRGSPSYGKLKV
jgi:hypothetical protein